MTNPFKVPSKFKPTFEGAQEEIARHFRERKVDPTRATIEIFGERYLLVRAATLSVNLYETIRNMYGEGLEVEASDTVRSLMYDLAHAMGTQDVRNYSQKMQLHNPLERLSAGPVLSSYMGWALVEMLPGSNPYSKEDFYLIYDHPNSFEADAWVKSAKKSDFPVCDMNAGYAAGWCSAGAGTALIAAEVLCRAKGDDCCRFIMGSPGRIEKHLDEYRQSNPKHADRVAPYKEPGGFFSRHKAS